MDTKDTKNGPERVGEILSRMKRGGQRIAPDAPAGHCVLCGTEATHADSIVLDKDREHFECREKLRKELPSPIVLEQHFVQALRTLLEDKVLHKRLEARLLRFTDKPTAGGLCRMITFCLAEIEKDPSIRSAKKTYLSTLLEDIRRRYLPTN